MHIQIGKTKIEAGGGYLYIQAFGREVFVKRERGQSLMPYLKKDEHTNERFGSWDFIS